MVCLHSQIKTNKDDIETIKNSGPSQEVQNQLNQLNTKVATLESKVQSIEQVNFNDILFLHLIKSSANVFISIAYNS